MSVHSFIAFDPDTCEYLGQYRDRADKVEYPPVGEGEPPGEPIYSPDFPPDYPSAVIVTNAQLDDWNHNPGTRAWDAASQSIIEVELPPVPPPTEAELLAYAADKRWRVETGGIVVSGVPIATDDRSKTMIMGARLKADSDPAYVARWKNAAGEFVDIDAVTIIAVSDAVASHVDACFVAESLVAAEVLAGEINDFANIDGFAWPA